MLVVWGFTETGERVQLEVMLGMRQSFEDERDAKPRLQALVDELGTAGLSSAGKCLADDLDALVVHLRHRRRWRSTNLLERSLGEVERRTKVMGCFPGEGSCLTLVWAVLDLLITHETNGTRFTEQRQRGATRRSGP